MVFSSLLFLFAFLPLVLALYYGAHTRARNTLLLVASLCFYAWGDLPHLVVLAGIVAANHGFGLAVERTRGHRAGSLVVAAAVGVNLGVLCTFKYGNFLVGNLALLLPGIADPAQAGTAIALPLGISFFTFQAMSYVIDIARGVAPAQRNPLTTGLYIALFPQLIAGPIVRYGWIAKQLERRRLHVAGFARGIRRFTRGLARKVLIADALAIPADGIFGLPSDQLTFGVATLGVACFTLQIYHDFAGYSDMAIGLGRMFGFRFPENFDTPYASRSLREFWRRWHMTLSQWFRDYLYIPLGGSRQGRAVTARNLVIVFVLCGLWHGAAWTFVAWGLFHGLFLALERLGDGRWLDDRSRWVQHGYLLVVVCLGWVLFRAETLGYAAAMAAALVGAGGTAGPAAAFVRFWNAEVALALLAGAATAAPWVASGTAAGAWWDRIRRQWLGARHGAALELLGVALMFYWATAHLAAASHSAFIYFRF